ncbi:MAG: hypothetical protein HPY76_07750 [Anaerolineae bacterium]|jgi:hypothetical protein|nr:hypothetical protein [Anaerolineae bacterium]
MRASQRIELAFWDLVVEVLSESRPVRSAVQFIGQLFNPAEFPRLLKVAMFAAIFGFCFGIGVTFFFDLLLTLY